MYNIITFYEGGFSMENVQRKAVHKTVYAFLMFLVIRLLEELVVIPHFHLDTKGLVSCILGIVILLVYIRFDNKALDEIGLLFSAKKVGKGIGIALLLNLVAGAIIFGVQYLHMSRQDGSARLTLYYDGTDHAFSAGLNTFLFWAGFGLIVAVFHAVFYELSFRGLLLTIGMRSLSFSVVNALQACLYAVWYLIPILRVLVYSPGARGWQWYVQLTLFMLAYEFITAFRLGLLRRASGSLWVCIFDHIGFAFILDFVHMQYTAPDMSVANDPNLYVQLIAYQLVSLLICFVYYQKKNTKARAKLQEIKLEESARL